MKRFLVTDKVIILGNIRLKFRSIAYKLYKNPTYYEGIIKANPDVEIEPVLVAGIKLKIPVLDESETMQFELPPRKE